MTQPKAEESEHYDGTCRDDGTCRRDGRRRSRWLGLAALLSAAVVAWEYLLNALMSPEADWNLVGVGAHAALDLALTLPLVAAALAVALRLARRMRMETGEWAGALGIAGLACLVFMAAMLPVVTTRDLAHEWMGNTYGLSLAEVRITQVRSDLTVQESAQLCSFSSLRNPNLARRDYGELGVAFTVFSRLEAGLGDLLRQTTILLPLLLVGLFLRFRGELPRPDFRPALALLRWWARPLRYAAAAAAAALALFYFNGMTVTEAHASLQDVEKSVYDACSAGAPVKTYDVSAINVEVTLNRYADNTRGFMYALDANVPAVRAEEAANAITRNNILVADDVNLPGQVRVTPGLRKDAIQPLVIRANLGECVRINLTNEITSDSHPVSLHILGLPHRIVHAGATGNNTPHYAATGGGTVSYEISVPLDHEAERAYYFHDQGGTRDRQSLGLFGALVVEPRGATYLDVETGDPLDTVTGSTWEAIIVDPNLDGRPDGKSFREFVIIYHEIGNEGFRDILDYEGTRLPLLDPVALSGVYRPDARAFNYRSEPFRRRIELDQLLNAGTGIKNGKSLGYSSFPFGDPATPIPRSYLGEATKTRLVHGGTEIFHVHHLHGGGDRWRRNPNADPNSDFWKGLTKVPKSTIKSVHLDSQSIGPGTTYSLEHECGAGGCQQAAGDFLYHCHIGHHYIAGMWSFWRVFDTVQTAETNINGKPLFVYPGLFQADNPFDDDEAPSNTPPAAGVSAGGLIGLQVDWNRTIVDDGAVTHPLTQVGVRKWIRDQLPPPGVPLDNADATVWDWVFDESGPVLKVYGAPEETTPIAGWESATPGQRVEVLFNPRNGRYTWPLFRPQAVARPPFTARHSGAPWLGENMIPGRIDGLCAHNLVHPQVLLPLTKRTRFYPISSITLPIPITSDKNDPDGMIFVLNEHEDDVLAGVRPAEPLAIRSNVGDCVEIVFTNKIPDGPLNQDFSKVNIHSHFVQFDPQASDGVITGYAYEQSVRPLVTENRTLTVQANKFQKTLKVTNTNRLRVGVWIGIGLGEGTCGSLLGQPLPCTEVRQIASIPDANTVVVDDILLRDHPAGEAVGVEFVKYNWYSDVDFGTVFFHQHVDFKDWDHGLFGAHIVEPVNSSYHDPTTGAEIRAGTLADIRVSPSIFGKPASHEFTGSFREFVLFLHNNNPTEFVDPPNVIIAAGGGIRRGGATINLRAEPWRLRGVSNTDQDPLDQTPVGVPPFDSHLRFSSVRWGDPHTPIVRAYVGDPFVVRGVGLVERVDGIRFTGHRFNMERNTDESDLRDTTFIGISERFDFAFEGGAGGPGGYAGDYLYYNTVDRDFRTGGWGLMRVYDDAQGNLQALPGHPAPSGGSGFPQLSFTGGAPPSLSGAGDACPPSAPVRQYDLAIDDTTIRHNDLTAGEPGVAYFLDGAVTAEVRTPMVLRVNAGECLRVNLRNERSVPAGLSVGELVFDPQRAYGSAIGLNYGSMVDPGAVRTYEYYADRDLGLTMGLNLGDIDSVPHGAYAAVVVEPAGSTYFDPGTNDPLPGGGTGVQADIVTGGEPTREFVAVFSNQDNRLGLNEMPYPRNVQAGTFHSLSYSNEPLSLRNQTAAPADVFRSDLHGDPRHVVEVPAGTRLVYRVGIAWGNHNHTPALEGHRYRQEARMTGSQVIANDVMVPGMTLDMDFLGGAGGDLGTSGDYLFHDRRLVFTETGTWHLVRVTDPLLGSARAPDEITAVDVHYGGGDMTVRGVVSTMAAGNTVDRIAVYDGVRGADGGCEGTFIGDVAVDPGNGRWSFVVESALAPSKLCVESPGGGVLAGAPGELVSERLSRLKEQKLAKVKW